MRMKYQTHLVPIFEDNYIFVIENLDRGSAVAVDPGEAGKLLEFIESRNLNLEAVLVTHHHSDHIDGLEGLLEYSNAKNRSLKIYAPETNKSQIKLATDFLIEENTLSLLGLEWQVIALPGHTLGHIAYYCSEQGWLFSGDVLFGLGCGRLFEGTADQMFLSLKKIKLLSDNTKIFCTHEYTEANLNFCKQLQENQQYSGDQQLLKLYEDELVEKRTRGAPSVPLLLKTELNCNPMLTASTVKDFAFVRSLRNKF